MGWEWHSKNTRSDLIPLFKETGRRWWCDVMLPGRHSSLSDWNENLSLIKDRWVHNLFDILLTVWRISKGRVLLTGFQIFSRSFRLEIRVILSLMYVFVKTKFVKFIKTTHVLGSGVLKSKLFSINYYIKINFILQISFMD